ncbi:MAG: AraC family transcriptional regulator [Lentisphaeria bacterium]|nr:AraC family transcriptional regulator [Lentisphaeria bacterium]
MDRFQTLFRPDTAGLPEIPLPFYPRSLGHVFRDEPRHEFYPAGTRNFVELFWCIRGEGEVVVQDKPYLFSEGCFFYYLPYEAHSLRGLGSPWEYRWVTFDGPDAEKFMRGYSYPRTCFRAGKCPEPLFREQEELMREMSGFAWREMVAVICRILARAGGMTDFSTPQGRLVAETLRICRERFHDPALNVNALAEELGICRSSLLRMFQEKMHMPPSEYLMRLRLQNAVSLLRDPRRTLADVAARSGFADPAYFSRVIREKYGFPPSKLRKHPLPGT